MSNHETVSVAVDFEQTPDDNKNKILYTPSQDEMFGMFSDKRSDLADRISSFRKIDTSMVDAAQKRLDSLNFGSMGDDMTNARNGLRDAKALQAEAERMGAAKAEIVQKELDDLNAEWVRLGGADVDAAQELFDGLNLNSAAEDRIYARQGLRHAKAKMHENFLRELASSRGESEPLMTGDGLEDSSVDATPEGALASRPGDDMPGSGEGDSSKPFGPDDASPILAPPRVGIPIGGGLGSEAVDGTGMDVLDSILGGGNGTTASNAGRSGSGQLPGERAKRLPEAGDIGRWLYFNGSRLFARIQEKAATISGFIGDRLTKQREDESQEAYEKRKKRHGKVAVGLGVVAAGVTVAFLTKDYWGGGNHPSGLASVGDTAPSATPGPDVVPLTPDVSHDAAIPAFSADALHVHSGEGGLETLRDMGVPAADRAALWEKIGSTLNDVDPGSVFRMENGDWGWSNAGQLSQKAQGVFEEALNK